MRNLHTSSHSGLEFNGDTSSIGRGSTLNQLQAGKFKDAVASATQGNSNRSFSHESKWSVMLNNLRLGMNFIDKQNSNLHEMENSLRLWRGSLESRAERAAQSFFPETALYLQSILRLSEEKLFNHPLFGSGVEPPIRIHLVLRGERFAQEVSVNPLLNKPGFCALVHSGMGASPPSFTHFDSCETEFLNALLQVRQNGDEITRQMTRIEESSTSSLSFHKVHPNPGPSANNMPLPRLLQWVSKLIKPWRRTQACAP
jgi:hypothetical protein